MVEIGLLVVKLGVGDYVKKASNRMLIMLTREIMNVLLAERDDLLVVRLI